MSTLQMNETRWSIARDLAHKLHELEVDKNEVKKVTAFMRQYHKAADALDKFKTLLHQLANSNDAPIQSNQTREYYKKINACCQEHLKDINEPNELLLILGWCCRLMHYYEADAKRAVEEQRPQQPKQQQAEQKPKIIPLLLRKEKSKPKYTIGNKLKAKVLKKQGIKVTVQLQTDEKQELVFETGWFPKNVDDEVNVKVTSVDDNGNIKKVVPN